MKRRISLTDNHLMAIDLVREVLLQIAHIERRFSFNPKGLDIIKQRRGGKAGNFIREMTVVADLGSGEKIECHLECTVVDDHNDFHAFAPRGREPLPVYIREIAIQAKLTLRGKPQHQYFTGRALRFEGQMRVEVLMRAKVPSLSS